MILITGATGYIGGRLVPLLLARGHRVRCLVRDASRLEGRLWREGVEVVEGDVLRADTLAAAFVGVDVAYYLVHSMAGGGDFHERDMHAARNVGAAAHAAGVERIIFLGGLAGSQENLSPHLRSRVETGDALREAGVPVTEFQAGVIVGSGSLSFEIIRYLAERVPIMITPRWVSTRTQPLGVADVLAYLASALDVPESTGRVIQIGGAEVVTYGGMMRQYAEARGLRRVMVPVPLLTPRLSSYWINLVTPIPASIARPLVEGLRNENVVTDPIARSLFPHIVPATYGEAVARALEQLEARHVETSWSDSLGSTDAIVPLATITHEGMILERRRVVVHAGAARAFAVFTGIGGQRGWFALDWAWHVRGWMDRLVGGVGLRRGRRDPDDIRVGDALDFWRVEALTPDRSMTLRAEMLVPGKAWLHFTATPRGAKECVLTQTAYFAPKGLAGWLYWYAMAPFHTFIFGRMIREIARRAER